MKKFLFAIMFLMAFTLAFVCPFGEVARAENGMTVCAKSAYLMDKDTGSMLFGQNENARLPIASMVKIMTAMLTFETVDAGNLAFDEKITVSETASGMGGSQMFLQNGLEYPVTDLLKGVIVVSANDACVALAERICGSEDEFVRLMNKRAAELGMNDTCFVNCTGLPKSGQYSTAHDVAIMLNRLMRHGEYANYSKIWLEDYTHPDGRITTLTNTNKFVRFYSECDGGKTGFTNEAGFCLAASAKRGDTRLISVVIGVSDSKTRFAESKKLLSYGFANYKTETVVKAGDNLGKAPVNGGKIDAVPFTVKDNLSLLLGKNDQAYNPEVEFEFDKVSAPLKKGDKVGVCKFSYGESCKTVELVALEDVPKATLGDTYGKIIGKWSLLG